MILRHDTNQYTVDVLVAEAPTYRMYICQDVVSGQQGLLQISSDVAQNGGLERAAFVLKRLRQTSDLFEVEYAKRGGEGLLSYERLFPQVRDSFISEEQGSRRCNVLTVSEVDDVHELSPLSWIPGSQPSQRIALPSSAWVMGRLLKLLAFAHGEGVAVRSLASNNILLEFKRHFVVVLDWSSSLTYPGEVPTDARKDDIANAAQAVFGSIGGDADTGDFPYDGESQYVDFIWRLVGRRESDAQKVHDEFYELVNDLWGRSFRPFRVLPRH